ncbi:MAG: hypothetical protein PHC68_00690 [Syntrophorhabdaceae bacterium]|nr:hypothetical protein [Syntrophorhabdaceae bacterium]
MKKAILYGILVWFLLAGTAFAQVYEPNDDNKPVFVGTRGGVSVYTEPHGVAFYVDFSKGRLDEGRKAANGGIERTVFQGAPQTRTAVTATYISKDGTLLSSTTYAPRVEWIAGIPAALVESGGSNICTLSDNLNSSTWVKTRCSMKDDGIKGLDGITTAYGVVPSVDNNDHHFFINKITTGLTLVPNMVYTYSGYTKTGVSSWARVRIYHTADSSALHDAYFNVSTGTRGTANGVSAYSIASAGNGWYRWSVSVSSPGVISQVDPMLYAAEGNNDTTFVGDNTNSHSYWWGMQLEQSPFPTSLIPTSGTSLQRAADSGVTWPMPTHPVTGNNLLSGVSNPWTVVLDFRPVYNASDLTGVTQAILDCSGGSTIFELFASGVSLQDGATGATVAYTPVANKTVRLVAQANYQTAGRAKMKVGIDSGSGISWGTEVNYDGSMSIGSLLRVLTSPWGRAHVAQLAIFSRIVDDGEINMWGSP